jgi:hypothetical protein
MGEDAPPQPVDIVAQIRRTTPKPTPRTPLATNLFRMNAMGNRRIGRITKADALPGRVSENTTVT